MRATPLLLLATALLAASPATAQQALPARDSVHVVFVTGDDEYRSEESMPMLARILKRDHGFRVTVLYALDDRGVIDPGASNIPGMETLESADLMVLFTRWRALPENQLRPLLDYVESGRPVVGFRTTTHALRYQNDSTRAHLNDDWPRRVFGQRWITHHGHFADNQNPLTSVSLVPWKGAHPVLRGVKPFQAYSWLYHVDGGADELYGDSKPLLIGQSLRSTHGERGATDRYPLTQPVAWTKTYTGASGVPARVFFTTLGHPYDFREEAMRKLALNGILWALGREAEIPPDGARAEMVGEYLPHDSGMGPQHKHGLVPEPI